jgi:hypothetical protein
LPDFGGYIQDLLREACALPGTLDIIRDEIVDLTRREDGSFQLIGKSGCKLEAAQPHRVAALLAPSRRVVGHASASLCA